VRVLALCGGIGGAKLALGLAAEVPAEDLAIMVNTGDDFSHFGLAISPDIDTVLYTLAGIANRELGWGLEGETWAFMDQLKQLGGEDWFNLGDRDLALHVLRTHRLARGASLAAITADIAARLGIGPTILPMSDDPVRTVLDTGEGLLEFQRYFVERRAQPQVRAIRYDGADTAKPNPAALAALADPALEAVIVCPSNPWLSVAPILAIPGLRSALQACPAPVVAVSPIVGGKAIKGPTAKLMAELGLPVSATAVADYYGDLLDGFVLDEADQGLADEVTIETTVLPTVMTDLASKQRLARDVLRFAQSLRA
jgi:LPPG:FO 2-phospho-L-lactate transferase